MPERAENGALKSLTAQNRTPGSRNAQGAYVGPTTWAFIYPSHTALVNRFQSSDGSTCRPLSVGDQSRVTRCKERLFFNQRKLIKDSTLVIEVLRLDPANIGPGRAPGTKVNVVENLPFIKMIRLGRIDPKNSCSNELTEAVCYIVDRTPVRPTQCISIIEVALVPS